MYIRVHMFFLFLLGLIISNCARKDRLWLRWILDLELLLLISRIARKWNRAKTFFAALSFSPQKSISSKNKRFLKKESLWLLNGDYKKMFLLM